MSRLITLVAALSAASLAGNASAADVPIRKSPVMSAVSVSNWSGVYGGLQLGALLTTRDWRTLSLGSPAAAPVGLATRGFDQSAFRTGLFIGYNYQFAPTWVAGIEADIGYGFTGKKTTIGLPGSGFPANTSDRLSAKGGWDGSLRARLGYLITPTVMLYGTGGLAFQQNTYTALCTATATGACTINANVKNSDTYLGWTIGAGLEAMLTNNWLVRAEYRYADFGKETANYIFNPAAAPVESGLARTSLKTHNINVGLAYKF